MNRRKLSRECRFPGDDKKKAPNGRFPREVVQVVVGSPVCGSAAERKLSFPGGVERVTIVSIQAELSLTLLV